MSWKKACFIYCLALAVTLLVNIEKVSVWVDDRLADGATTAPIARDVRHIRNVWREFGLAGYSRALDCRLAPYFDETYKNSLTCRDEPASQKAAEALRMRLDPNQPLLKDDVQVDTDGLLAALAPPLPAQSETAATQEPQATTSTTPALETPLRPLLSEKTTQTPRKLLVVGDSLAIGLSLSLRRSVAELVGVNLIEEGKVSSGLANPKYYDWGKALRVFVEKYNPDLVVIMMGANDAKYINPDEKPRPPGSSNKSWADVFAMRIEQFLSVLDSKKIRNYWIGLPIMGDAGYARQALVMNAIIKTECNRFPESRFLDTWTLLSDEKGNYSTFLPNDKGVKIKIRANDKVHFTVAGGDILARSLLSVLAKDLGLTSKTGETATAAAAAR